MWKSFLAERHFYRDKSFIVTGIILGKGINLLAKKKLLCTRCK